MMPIIKPVKSCYFIKWLNPKFHEHAAEIECHSGERLWNLADIQRCIRCYGCVGHVITHLKTPVGYSMYKVHKAHRRVNLLNIVVLPDFRRKGLATLLLDNLRKRLVKYGANRITACVRETNQMAHKFLLANDFKGVGVASDRYVDVYPDVTDQEDGYLFRWRV